MLAALASAHGLFSADEITVNLNSPRQTIDGIGYNHEGDRQNGDTYIIDSNIQQMLDEGITLFRDMFPNKTWEPSPGTFGYNDVRVTNSFQRLKEMQNRGITTILGLWDLPNWLVNTSSGQRKINNVNDVADFITSFLVRGKQQYGLDVDYVDFNESETGVNILLTAAEYSSIVSACQTRFANAGLITKFNQGSALLWSQGYATSIYNSTKTLSHAGVPSWHTYRGGNLTGTAREPLSLWKSWGSFALTLDRPLWATETDYDAYLYERPERLTWAGSQETAVMYWRTLYVARCSTMAGWYWHSDWSSYPIHTSYINHFKPGGQILDTRRAGDLQPGDYAEDQVFALGYRHVGQNKFVLQVLNQSGSDRAANFHGLPANTTLALIRTANGGENRHTVGTYTTDAAGNLSVSLYRQSFNTFTGNLGPVLPPAPNRAQNRPVVVSSTEDATHPGAAAVDGDYTTRWSSAYADNQSLQIDLGSSYNVTRVNLAWEAAYASHFQVQTSADAQTWTTVRDVSNNTQTVNDITGLNAAARYVRINCLTRATVYGFSLFEIVVNGDPITGNTFTVAASARGNGSISPSGNVTVAQGASQTFTITPNSGYAVGSVTVDGVNVGAVTTYTFSNVQAGHNITASFVAQGDGPNRAYARPVWTSSIQGAGYEGSKAVDANGNTRWASATANNQALYVDLGSNYNVTRVRLAWEAAYAKDYQIQFSTDGTTWTTVRDVWGKTSAAADNQTGLSGTARYVKVYCINRATQYGFSLREFEVYGQPAP